MHLYIDECHTNSPPYMQLMTGPVCRVSWLLQICSFSATLLTNNCSAECCTHVI